MDTVELEREIINRFQQLDSAGQQRVLETLNLTFATAFDYAAWWQQVQSLQRRLSDKAPLGVLSLLNDLREESA